MRVSFKNPRANWEPQQIINDTGKTREARNKHQISPLILRIRGPRWRPHSDSLPTTRIQDTRVYFNTKTATKRDEQDEQQ